MNQQQVEAMKFWHERIGRFMGDAEWDKSISCAYPLITKNGVKPQRIGSGAPAAIMIDQRESILIERIAPEHPVDASVRIVNSFDMKKYSLIKTVLEWMVSRDRIYPMLAMLPTKRGIAPFMSLSVMESCASLIAPGDVLTFDVDRMRNTRDELLSLDKPHDWREAARLRAEVENMPIDADSIERNGVMKKYLKISQSIPESVWLPKPGTSDYDVLGKLMIQKDAMPL